MPDFLTFLEISGTLLGFVYMYLEYKAKYALWWVGIVWSLCYGIIFVYQGFYAWALTWLYYIGANIYGLFSWKKKTNDERKELSITHLKKKHRLPVVLASILLTVPIGVFVKNFNPYVAAEWDMDSIIVLLSESVSTALSIVGMVLLSKKVVEQWIIWVIVNALYLIGSLYAGDYPLVLFYIVYTTMSVMGWRRWQKESAQPTD